MLSRVSRFETLLACSFMSFFAIVGLQGFDIADEGWSMTAFQQVFSDPQSVEYLFMYYLTNIVGGLWELLFGRAGIYGYRLLAGIVLTAASMIVWRVLRPYFDRWSIAAGLWIAALCSSCGIMVFYHNYLTELLVALAAAALLRALTGSSRRWMAVSGFILGCNVFVRLPNIALTALILLLIPYHLYNRDRRQTTAMGLAAVAGFTGGVCFVLLLMVVLQHLGVFTDAIAVMTSAGTDPQSNHNVLTMLHGYLLQYAAIVLHGYGSNLYTVYLLASLLLLWVSVSRSYKPHYVYLALTGLIVMHFQPLGSDLGISNCGENSIRLAVPLLTGFLWKMVAKTEGRRGLLLRMSTVVLLAIVVVRGMVDIVLNCYYDIGPRWEKTWRVDSPLATTLTTHQNCKALNPLLHELPKYVRRDDRLLCFQTAPTIHYLTHTRPYLYNPWPWCYDPVTLERQLRRAESEYSRLPVIVRDKMMIFNWSEYYPDWDNDHATENYLHKNRRISAIRRFISRHGYRVAWENEVFQILLPGDRPAD